jgi:hypothetical protein
MENNSMQFLMNYEEIDNFIKETYLSNEDNVNLVLKTQEYIDYKIINTNIFNPLQKQLLLINLSHINNNLLNFILSKNLYNFSENRLEQLRSSNKIITDVIKDLRQKNR